MVSIWYGFVCLVISIPLSEAIQCQGSAIYTLTFKAEWTKDSHLDFPPNPHFSRLVGCSHKSSYVMWRPGVNATVGVQDVAELGRNDAINNEMDEQIRLKNALARYLGPGISGGTGTATQAGINVNSQYPLVSVITMIAPSPDWFIGVRDYSLCNETSGKWVEKRVKELFPYDSGTDSGPRFTSPNQATQPHEPIFLINNTEDGSFKSDKPINRFGTFTFEKTFESKPSTTTTNIISPEPTTTQLATAVMASSIVISIALSEAIQCKGSAIYKLTFKAEWTKDSHLDFPPNPHFSRLVGCSHNSSYVMWRPGVNATVGVKDVAELGKNDAINNEMDEQIRLKNALARYLGPNIRGGTGTAVQAGINVNSQYPLVSVITMIAPSPDWFIGVRDYSLCNETSGKWVEKRVKELFPYDSGTDSGPRFTSPNQATQPHEPIFLINNTEEGSFKSDKPINRFGTFTFEKTFESKPSTTTTNIISPEPTTTQLATAVMASSATALLEKPSSKTNVEATQGTKIVAMTSSVPLLEKPSSKVNVEGTQGTKIVAMTSPVPLLEKPSSKINVETTERTTIVAITSSVTLLEKPSLSKVNVEATQRTAPTTPSLTLSGKPSSRKTKVEATKGTTAPVASSVTLSEKPSLRKTKVEATQGTTAPVTSSVTLLGKPSSRKTKVEATQGTKTAPVTPSATPLEKSSSSEINVEATQRTTDPVASSVTPSGKPSLKKTKVEATEGTKTPVVTSSVTPSRTQLLPSATMSASGTCSFAYFNIHVFSILIIVSSFIM